MLEQHVVLHVLLDARVLVLRHPRHVPADDVEALAVLGDDRGVRTMLAAALQFRNHFFGADGAIGRDRGSRQRTKPDRVEVVKGEEETLHGLLQIQLGDVLLRELLPDLRDRHAEHARPALVRDDQATLLVEDQRDPGAVLFLVDLVDQLGREAGLKVQARGRILDRFFQWRQLVLPKGARQRERESNESNLQGGHLRDKV